MKRIAALYTCHNRKEKTLKSLEGLDQVKKNYRNKLIVDTYVTDDGSKDGTTQAIREKYPDTEVISGDGNLFWAEGMRTSWKKALEKEYDSFLLLNDDVELYPIFIEQLLKTAIHCKEIYGKQGIYIGATEDKDTNQLTYSGSLVLNKFLYTQKRLAPNGDFQECDLANANIMLVAAPVVKAIGILTEGYSHGMADYDYTLTARKHNIPVLLAPEYCGHCKNDHKEIYHEFVDKPFQERKSILNNPTGLAHKSYVKYMKKFFPWRAPFVVFFGWLKLYFPKFYVKFFIRKRSNALINT